MNECDKCPADRGKSGQASSNDSEAAVIAPLGIA